MALLTTEERIRAIQAHQADPGLSDADRLALLNRDVDWLIETVCHFLVFLRGIEEMAVPRTEESKIVAFPRLLHR